MTNTIIDNTTNPTDSADQNYVVDTGTSFLITGDTCNNQLMSDNSISNYCQYD